MTIVFFGNTRYSAIGAKIIHEQIGISHIVTIPDKLDKKHNSVPTPTKQFALENNIPVITAEKMTPDVIAQLQTLEPDFFVVEDYGLILPEVVLHIPKYAPINVHHSLLPKYRGPSPAPTAIRNGDTQTGVTIIHMSKKMDAGDIYAQTPYTIQATDTTDSLLTILNQLGGRLAVHVIKDIVAGKAIRTPQDETQATRTSFIQKADGFMDLAHPPTKQVLDHMIRAYYPWPGVWTTIAMPTGETKILKFLPEGKLQMEGKKPLSHKDFFNGYPELRNKLGIILNAEL